MKGLHFPQGTAFDEKQCLMQPLHSQVQRQQSKVLHVHQQDMCWDVHPSPAS
jgi:hypothetical protein